MLNIPASTLRYYDREGLLSNIKRNGGIRVFSDFEIGTLRMIECLKSTGMQIKDIKLFLDWCQEGDQTLEQRRDMFYERRAVVEKQMEELQKTLEVIQYNVGITKRHVKPALKTPRKMYRLTICRKKQEKGKRY